MVWVILLLAHLVGLVGYNLLLRRTAVAGKFHPWVLATLLQTGIMVPMILAIPFLPIDFGRITTITLLVMSVVVVLGVVLLSGITKALHYLEASTFSVVYNLRIIIVAVLSTLLLSELPSLLQIIGGLMILLAIIIIKQKGSKKITGRGMAWGVGMAFTISVLGVAEKFVINEVGIFTAGPIITVAVGFIMWGVTLARRLPVPKKHIFTKQVIWLMLLRSLSNWAFVFALAAGALVSVATFVSSLSIVIIVALGALLLGEHDFMWRKAVAVVVAVCGLVAVLFGGLVWPLYHPTAQQSAMPATIITHSTDKPDEAKPSSSYRWQGSANDPKKIIIPSIGVDAYLQNVGVDQNNQIAVPNNIHMGGWFADSARPGDKGLSIIDGHLNGVHSNGVFINLNRLKTGDIITIQFGDISKKNFLVKKNQAIKLSEAGSALFSQDPNISNQLTLITCGGEYNPQTRLYDMRIVVTAELVDR